MRTAQPNRGELGQRIARFNGLTAWSVQNRGEILEGARELIYARRLGKEIKLEWFAAGHVLSGSKALAYSQGRRLEVVESIRSEKKHGGPDAWSLSQTNHQRLRR